MLKFKKGGKLLGIIRDDASEPEGEAFKFKEEDEPQTNLASKEEVPEEEEDATVE